MTPVLRRTPPYSWEGRQKWEECLQQTSVLASSQVHEVCRKFLSLLMIKSDASVTLEDFQAIGKENEAEDGMVGAGKTLGKRVRTPLEAAEGHA